MKGSILTAYKKLEPYTYKMLIHPVAFPTYQARNEVVQNKSFITGSAFCGA